MLTPLDVVDWSGLRHAFGEADDVPGLIEQLLDDDWADAVDDLFALLLDQGRVYPATVVAVPFLVDVALDEDAPGRLGAVQVLAGFAGAARSSVDLGALREETARRLWVLATDPDPEVRVAVYQVAGAVRTHAGAAAGLLTERLAAEEDASARVELARALVQSARAADDGGLDEILGLLPGLLAHGHDAAVFAVAWSLLATGVGGPEVVSHLVRLWSTQAKAYPVGGSGDPVGALAQEAGIHAVPVLFRLATDSLAAVGDLAWAWHDLARSSRFAFDPALEALLALTAPTARSEEAEDLVGALVPLLPVAGARRREAADQLMLLKERISGPPETQAAFAVALFVLRDPRWVTPALAATAAEQPPYVTVGGSSVEFSVALAEFGPGEPDLVDDLVDVAMAAITAWPDAVDSWAELLARQPLSAESGRQVVGTLLADGAGPITSKAVMRLLARTAAEPAAFDVATFRAVRDLPVPGGDAGAWLLVTQAQLDSGDPAAFARAWRMGETGEGEEELLRIWAAHPSPELEQVCRELIARTNWGVFRSRAVQVVAMEVLSGPSAESVWPALLSRLDLAGLPAPTLADAVALGNRLAVAHPGRRSEWVARLRKLAESNDFVAPVVLEALQALGEIAPEQALDRALNGVDAVAGTRRAAEAGPAAARVIRTALAGRPDLRPGAMQRLAPLIEGGERVVAPADITTDTGLVRNLREACAG